jgi:hypothetical protein
LIVFIGFLRPGLVRSRNQAYDRGRTRTRASELQAMKEHEASRTLVKSPPELWAECSDAASLARHLGEPFGAIRITRLEPETAVAWEGERASGTVRLEPTGWGTRVTLTAGALAVPGEIAEAQAEPQAPAGDDGSEPIVFVDNRQRDGKPEPEPESVAEPEAPADSPPAEPPPAARQPEPAPAAMPAAAAPSLGTARRRRFARLRAWFAGDGRAPGAAPAELPAAAVDVATAAVIGQTEPVAPAAPAVAEPAPAVAEPAVAEPAMPAREAVAVMPDAVSVAAADSAPAGGEELDAGAALAAALESLGKAHHRPYSRFGKPPKRPQPRP